MDFYLAPFYKTLFVQRASLDAQHQVEYEAREADRLHRERARELKYKKITEAPIWIPSRLRPRKRPNKNNLPPAGPPPTTIKWADCQN